MKKLLLFLLTTVTAFATTTIAGRVQTLGTGNVASGAYVRFWLRGCGGNQPRINGTSVIAPTQGGVYYFDFPVNASGNISGTLYSTRNSAGTGNGDIECGGSFISVWYGMQVFTGGKGGPEVAVHAKSGGTLDVSNVTPITTNPVIVAPTGDSTYLRLDAGNSPVTGSISFIAPANFTSTALFTGETSTCTMNLRKNVGGGCAAFWGGGDIGAQINAAAATCVAGSQCHITIAPSTQQSFSTSIAYVANETLECVRMGLLANDTSGDAVAPLNYTGTGIAVTMGSDNGRFVGCDLKLGTSATEGVHVGGTHAYSNHIEDASIRDGGTATILVHFSCVGGFCEDNHLAHSRLSNFIGTGVAIDNANDTYLYQNTVYGHASNATSTHLVVDSGSGGVIIDNFVGGSVGLHGFIEKHALSGNFPTFLFANDMEMDGTPNSTECWLFDSTLGSANIDATFMNSWAAGCSHGTGVHISGGSGIHIGSGSRIRVNGKDGILIDVTGGAAEYGTIIEGSFIQGNNSSNAGFSGISITGHPGGTVIAGNDINNFPEVGGFQQYAVNVTGDVEGLVFSNNNCSQNVVGCYNGAGVAAAKLSVSGNVAPDLGTPPATEYPGDVISVGNFIAGLGANVVYRCATAGATLPVGSLTINAAACGSTVDTGLRVK